MEGMEIPRKYLISKNTLYFDDYGEGEQKEQFLLAIYHPDFPDGFRLQFSFGMKKQCLTTFKNGREIECTTGYGWSILKTVDEEGQRVYWELEKKQEEREYYEPCLWIAFSNILVKKAGIAYLEIMDKAEETCEYVPIIKAQMPPEIVRFAPVTATVRKGQKAILKWETCGAESCVINPGNYQVAASGILEIKPEETMLYTLDASRGEEKETKKARVYLYEDILEDYLIAEPDVYYRGCSLNVHYLIGDNKGVVTLKAGGTPVEIRTNENDTMKASFISAEKVAFSYKEQGVEKNRYLELCPDEEQVIMKYVVAAKRQETDKSIVFGVEWCTKGAFEIQIFVRVYPLGEEKTVNDFQEYLIMSLEEEGIAAWTPAPDFSGRGMYFFFLRTKNSQGELKEAVYAYEDDKEVGYYDNLGK